MYPLETSTLAFDTAYRQLRPAERVYVDEFVKDVEQTSLRAGERISNALYRQIPDHIVAASRGMLERPMVRAAITERIKDLAAASELTPHRALKEMTAIAFSSMGHYMTIDPDGTPVFDLARCTPEQLSAIKSIEVEEGVRGGRKFKLQLHDKLAGLTAVMKFMGMLDNDNPIWKAESARPASAPLPASITETGAAERYAAALNG